ncbi:unnamed protein product [Caenorhabditis sp. 36 PRJEB53466]|nr:unnamed protein product [Caenorhabditis sp. 36 PRJEB53466]
MNSAFVISLLFIVFFLFLFYFRAESDALSAYSNKLQVSISFVGGNDPQKFLSSALAAPNRLGNHLFELAGLYGIAQTLARTPVFWIEDENYRRMLESTRELVPGLVERFTVFYGKVPSTVVETKFHENAVHLTIHRELEILSRRRDEILSYLRPPKTFKILPTSDENTVVTCVHVRRGDFREVGYFSADPELIRKALKHLEHRFAARTHLRLLTVLFGDDRKFMGGLFPNSIHSNSIFSRVKPTTKYFISSNPPSEDLLYSSQHCDRVLITAPVSTFGWWMGYLSKGNEVFYLDVRTVSDVLYESGKLTFDDFYPPKWTALRLSADNSTLVESEN